MFHHYLFNRSKLFCCSEREKKSSLSPRPPTSEFFELMSARRKQQEISLERHRVKNPSERIIYGSKQAHSLFLSSRYMYLLLQCPPQRIRLTFDYFVVYLSPICCGGRWCNSTGGKIMSMRFWREREEIYDVCSSSQRKKDAFFERNMRSTDLTCVQIWGGGFLCSIGTNELLEIREQFWLLSYVTIKLQEVNVLCF